MTDNDPIQPLTREHFDSQFSRHTAEENDYRIQVVRLCERITSLNRILSIGTTIAIILGGGWLYLVERDRTEARKDLKQLYETVVMMQNSSSMLSAETKATFEAHRKELERLSNRDATLGAALLKYVESKNK